MHAGPGVVVHLIHYISNTQRASDNSKPGTWLLWQWHIKVRLKQMGASPFRFVCLWSCGVAYELIFRLLTAVKYWHTWTVTMYNPLTWLRIENTFTNSLSEHSANKHSPHCSRRQQLVLDGTVWTSYYCSVGQMVAVFRRRWVMETFSEESAERGRWVFLRLRRRTGQGLIRNGPLRCVCRVSSYPTSRCTRRYRVTFKRSWIVKTQSGRTVVCFSILCRD